MAKRGKKKGIYKVERVLSELRKRRRVLEDQSSEVTVGYSAPYAAAVHERLDVHHPIGQAKYLEQPLRTEEKAMRDIVRSRLRARETLKQAHLTAAKHLMKISLQLVPIDTGVLRGSWFIK